MGKTLEALLHLQAVERDIAHVRRRLNSRKHAVETQQRRIEQLQSDWQGLHDQYMQRRKEADELEVELKQSEERVSHLRSALNSAKTNKEYAAILTQINTRKADNSKLEEQALRIIQEADVVQADADKVQEEVRREQQRLEEVQSTSADEIARLDAMMGELQSRRADAAQGVPPPALAAFERIASNYDGEAMAVIETHGKKPPFTYVCGGCFMGLNAEHANALRVRDELRTCDNCGRILYLQPEGEQARTE